MQNFFGSAESIKGQGTYYSPARRRRPRSRQMTPSPMNLKHWPRRFTARHHR
jgi:hypothetical protein